MDRIIVLVHDVESRARIRDGLRGAAIVRFCECHAEILSALQEGTTSAVLLEASGPGGESSAHFVEELRKGFPGLALIAYCDLRRVRSSDVLDLARAGVSELAFRGVDDVRLALHHVISAARQRATAEIVRTLLDATVPTPLEPLLVYCLKHAGSALTVAGVAASLGLHRRTLANRLASAGWPVAKTLVGWCRILIAARFLEDPGRRVECVALALDFPSATALRNMLRRYTGLRPSELRENGGLTCAVHLFKQALARGRSVPRASRVTG